MTGLPLEIEPLELRKAFGGFLTGVTVVTTIDAQGMPRGFTANSFTSVSLDPPLLLVCLDRRANCFVAFMEATRFAVNILADDQRSISSGFASKKEDKFAEVDWQDVAGSPVLDGSLVSFACAMHQQIDAGDHVILIGRVLDFAQRAATPLGFHSGNYVDFALGRHVLEAQGSEQVSMGAILEQNGKILMVKKHGHLILPQGRSLGEEHGEAGSLFALLRESGVRASVSFVYSLYHDAKGHLHIYYIGTIEDGSTPSSPDAILVPVDDLDWDALSQHAGNILKRYINERASNRFGIFVGTASARTVKGIGPDM